MLNVLLSFAQFEREVTGERIRDKIAASKKKGLWMGGTPPLGYEAKDRKLVVNEAEATLVQHIFRRYAQLSTVAKLTVALEVEGRRTKRYTSTSGRSFGGRAFSRGHLYRILSNRIYRGEIVHKDAAYPVQEAVAMIRALSQQMEDETDTLRFTVGRILVTPNTPNSVPNYVSFSIDLRHPDQRVLAERGDAIETTCRGATKHCTMTVTETFHKMPCRFDEAVVDTIEQATRALDLSYLRMPSGAFHDALFMNEVCPTGMIFVPCEKGISHNEAENARPEHLAAGARVLTAVLVELANR
jgi:hypothetical protein